MFLSRDDNCTCDCHIRYRQKEAIVKQQQIKFQVYCFDGKGQEYATATRITVDEFFTCGELVEELVDAGIYTKNITTHNLDVRVSADRKEVKMFAVNDYEETMYDLMVRLERV